MAYPDSESSKAFRKIAAAMAGFPVGEKPDTVQEGFIERLTRALLRRD
jgi:septum site-determining protein MinD